MMVKYDGLELGRKIREFSTKQEALRWKNAFGRKDRYWRGKRVYTIRKHKR